MPKKINLLVTAGPTREMLDPVRFLSNVSTGHMGYETARQAKRMGFDVTLISGPTALKPPDGVKVVPVLSARQMKTAVLKYWPRTHALIMTAAVCDYTPVHFSASKIKRIKQKTIQFKRTEDILALVGKKKGKRVIVGFALETENLERNAVRKLKRKNLDYIAANWYGPRNDPFGPKKTSMILIHRSGRKLSFRQVAKAKIAQLILVEVRKQWFEKQLKS